MMWCTWQPAGGLSQPPGHCAVPVAEDDRAAQVVGDALDLAHVQRQALAGVGDAELAGAQVGGQPVGAGHGVGGHREQGAAQPGLLLRGQRGGRGAGAAAAGAAARLAVVSRPCASIQISVIWSRACQSTLPITTGAIRASQASASAPGPVSQPGCPARAVIHCVFHVRRSAYMRRRSAKAIGPGRGWPARRCRAAARL